LTHNETLYVFNVNDLPKISREKYDRLTPENQEAIAKKANAIGERPQQRLIEAMLVEQNRKLRKEGKKPPVVTKTNADADNEKIKQALDEKISQLPAKSQKVVHEILTGYVAAIQKDVKTATDNAFKQREDFLNEREQKLNVLEANLNRQRTQLWLVVEEDDLKILRSFCHPDKHQDEDTRAKAHKAQLIVQKLMDVYDRGILRDQVANEKKRAASRKRFEEMRKNAGY
jgi:hypothetical protein